ncbi:ABC transporter permease [Sulfurimonas sp.]|uniref:ABC transporter permease n=1 Tax=Sulfurimonas sp. TaxID=2022749 RepID=UPI002AB1025F|nr:ABC transporter permease [Sulfurimonas sp.]
MYKVLIASFLYEIRSIKNSWYKFSLITFLPLVSFVLIISIFYQGVVRDMPITVVDNDKSSISAKLISNIQSSSTIDIKKMSLSLRDAMALVKRGEVYGVVVIPQHFYKDMLLQKQPKVTVMLNTQYILIGKILSAALTSTVMQSSPEIEYVKGGDFISPIQMQITPFFNTYQNYFLFLVSALLPAIWQIFIVVATLVSFGSMFKANEEKEFFKDGFIEVSIIGKLLPYTLSYLFLGIGYLLYMYQFLSWELQGSFIITIFGMFLTVVAYQGIALLFFVTGFDYARSLSLGAVYTAPAFAFLGVTFPIFNMNSFALFWRDMLPISHFVELQISQANYGLGFTLELQKLLILFSFWIIFVPVFYMFKRRLQR